MLEYPKFLMPDEPTPGAEPSTDTHTDPAPLPDTRIQPTLEPLVVGTTLLERYTVVDVLAYENGTNVYRVAEMRRCPNCGVDNEGNLTHCGFCGDPLPAPRTLVLTERPTPTAGQVIPASFAMDGLTYSFARDVEQEANKVQPAIRLQSHFLSDPGLARGVRGEPNEDSVLVVELNAQHAAAAPTLALFMIADGIGGAEAGEVASQLTIQTMAHEMLSRLLAPTAGNSGSTNEVVQEIIRASVAHANTQVMDYAQAHNVPLGSCLTLVLARDERAYFANVGDSRGYLFREDALTQITRDHSYVAQLVAKGEITEQEIRTHPQRNLILRSLGDPSGFEVDIFPETMDEDGLELQAGDQLLLCSDGLWEMVTDEGIAEVLASAPDAGQACAQLVSLANAAGGADNISVVVIRVESL